MQWWHNLTTNEKILGGFIGFILLAASLQHIPVIIMILLVLGVIYSSMNKNGRSTRRQQFNRYQPPQPPQSRPRSDVQPHALTAVRRAGLDPQAIQILTVDIGVMSFHGNQSPVIHRTWPIDDDCDYIQPFIQLRVPRSASGNIMFEIYDKYGELSFRHEDNYQLQSGTNLVVPAARLPVHDEQAADGTWEIQVRVGNMLIARHEFSWEATESPEFTRHVGEDGEISNELRAALYDSRMESMSIDDLLSFQDEAQNDQQAAQ